MNRLTRQLLLLLASVSLAGPALADVSISGLDPIRIDAWAGATGDLTGSDTFCTLSCISSCSRNSHRRDYDSAAYTNGASDGAGNFYIRNGSDYLLVYFDWTHPVDGTTRLTNYSRTGQTTGRVDGAYDCAADPNSQTRIDITLPVSQLASATAGVYSETFMIDVCRLNNNNSLAECLAAVDFTVTLPELVQISRLDNIGLGQWSGAGDIQVEEDFCVFRNGSGGFSININSANASGGNFNLVGTGSAPYLIELDQGSGFSAVSPGATTSGYVGSSTRECGNSDNMTMRITVDADDLAALQSGAFSDTIVIVAEPT